MSNLQVIVPLAVLFALVAISADGAKDGPPFISAEGVRNAASRMPPSLAGGAIARGSLFSIRGVRLGPAIPVRASSPALEIAGTVVLVNGAPVPILFTGPDRILARMPASTPIGEVAVSVSRDGERGPGRRVRVVASSPGIFGTHLEAASELPDELRRPTRLHAAPGSVVSLQTTGLNPALRATILVGGVKAKRILEIGDNLRFQLPPSVPLGCTVPVLVESAGVWSNAVVIAVEAAPGACVASDTWMTKYAHVNGRSGFVFVAHTSLRLESKGVGHEDHAFDIALAGFPDAAGAEPREPFSLPPAGLCAPSSAVFELGGVLNPPRIGEVDAQFIEFNVPFRFPEHRMRYAGPGFSIQGPSGERLVPYEQKRDYYLHMLGGTMPGAPVKKADPLFLDPGEYKVQSLGGGEVGEFGGSFQMPPALRWENRNSLSEIVRSRGFTVKWSGAAGRQIVVAVAAVESKTGAAGVAFCLAPAGASQFSVPAHVLANFPIAGNPAEGEMPIAGIALAALPSRVPEKLVGKGLDHGMLFPANFSVRQTVVR